MAGLPAPGMPFAAPMPFMAPPMMMPGGTVWRAHKAPDGRTYYYNITTMETQWNKPKELEDMENSSMWFYVYLTWIIDFQSQCIVMWKLYTQDFNWNNSSFVWFVICCELMLEQLIMAYSLGASSSVGTIIPTVVPTHLDGIYFRVIFSHASRHLYSELFLPKSSL